MDISNVHLVSGKVLRFLEDMEPKIPVNEKLAVLRSAAGTIESVIYTETMVAGLRLTLDTLKGGKP